MRIPVSRKDIFFRPDPGRVIVRFFMNTRERTLSLMGKVIAMEQRQAEESLQEVLREFAIRHRNITKVFLKHFDHVRHFLDELGKNPEEFSEEKKLLIGSYFTLEYSIESAAFFNPCIIRDPDQSGISDGELRVIFSFRATGEGHISSIVFRRCLILNDGNFWMYPVGKKVGEADFIRQHTYQKDRFGKILEEIDVDDEAVLQALRSLPDEFTYNELQKKVAEIFASNLEPGRKQGLQEIMWLADSHYELKFSLDTDISERVIFPVSPMESKGIEDARFVRFTESDGSVNHYATYTAYDGRIIMPKLIETRDFCHFRIRPLHGYSAQNKNLALFPRKINDNYVMLSRNDGVNNYIMFSQNLTIWNEATLLQQPSEPWQFVQLGNCGSPIETNEGWLLLIHGVGPMRQYCIGATLLDKEDPRIVKASLKEPLLVPSAEEREGYVPNVVYSCGSLIHNGQLIIPYGLSDYASSIATVDLAVLMDRLRAS